MNWNAWRTEVFGDGYMVWHEGADTDASTARWRQDPEGTSAALVLGLAADDYVAAEAVEAFARSGGEPGPDVTAAVVATAAPQRPARIRVAAAMAAYVVTADPAFVGVVVDVLRQRDTPPEATGWRGRRARRRWPADRPEPRSTAARLLAYVPTTRAVADALADAVAGDPEYLVRSHATSTLLRLGGADPQLTWSMVEAVSERGTEADRVSLARELRARVRTVD